MEFRLNKFFKRQREVAESTDESLRIDNEKFNKVITVINNHVSESEGRFSAQEIAPSTLPNLGNWRALSVSLLSEGNQNDITVDALWVLKDELEEEPTLEDYDLAIGSNTTPPSFEEGVNLLPGGIHYLLSENELIHNYD